VNAVPGRDGGDHPAVGLGDAAEDERLPDAVAVFGFCGRGRGDCANGNET